MAVREEELTSSPRPRARPDAMMGGGEPQAREASGGGGKGGVAESQDQIDKSMSDKKWGYFDPYTGKNVPWFIDMINGGGKNSAGDDFKGGFGTIGLAGAIANMLGVSPYGQDRERKYGGGDFYRGGELDPTLGYFYKPPAPAGGGGAVAGPQLSPALDQKGYTPVTSDPRGFEPNTEPMTPTSTSAARLEDRLMGQYPYQPEAAMGLGPFGGSLTPMEMSAVNRNYRIKGTNDPVGQTTWNDATNEIWNRYSNPLTDPRRSSERNLAISGLLGAAVPKLSPDDIDRLMPPNQEQIRQMEEARDMSLVDAMRRGNYTQPYANMGMGEAGRTSPVMADQVSYTGDAGGLAQQNLNNKDAMRQNMSNYTQQDWDNYTRKERRDRGLPVTELDRMFAGSDAFAQPPAPPSMVNRQMMIGVLKRAGYDANAIGVLDDIYIQDLYNKVLSKNPRRM